MIYLISYSDRSVTKTIKKYATIEAAKQSEWMYYHMFQTIITDTQDEWFRDTDGGWIQVEQTVLRHEMNYRLDSEE